jgi:cysteine desulfurase / selenocysteine lyase
MSIDVARARAETPACARLLHFNNAGAALMPAPVLAAVKTHLDLEARIGGYEAADAAADRLETVYDSVAGLVNCAREEVALVENATVAWQLAFHSLEFAPGDRILTAMAEYASNYIAYIKLARERGVRVEPVPNDADGALDVAALERMVDDRVKLVAVTHLPTNGGLVNPAEAIGRVARAHGIPYLLDACQSVGQLPIDVAAIGCDFLSATGRKYLRGPRGTGFLYARRSMLAKTEPPFIDLEGARWTAPDRYELRADARRYENWERYLAGQLGLGVAIDYARGWGLDAIAERVGALAGTLRRELAAIRGVAPRDLGRRRSGIVSFTVEGIAAAEIERRLRADAINVATSGPSSTLLDARARGLPDLVRASVHYYNSEEEVARFVGAIAAIAKRG